MIIAKCDRCEKQEDISVSLNSDLGIRHVSMYSKIGTDSRTGSTTDYEGELCKNCRRETVSFMKNSLQPK